MTQTDDLVTADHDSAGTTTSTASSTAVLDEAAPAPARARKGSGLTAMTLTELQGVAAGLGISGTARLRKGEIISAIQGARGDGVAHRSEPVQTDRAPRDEHTERPEPTERTEQSEPIAERGVREEQPAAEHEGGEARDERPPREDRPPRTRDRSDRGDRQDRSDRQDRAEGGAQQGGARTPQHQNRNQPHRDGQDRTQPRDGQDRTQPNGQPRDGAGPRTDDWDDDGEGRGRNRRGRYRDRRNRQGGRLPQDSDPVVSDDDVLVPVGGVVHMLENYAFVRTSGYLAGPNDVYVSMAQVKRYALRPGDVVRGAVRQVVEGESKQKYNPLVRLDSINGLDIETARARPDFAKLVPLYPNERLRLETEQHILTTRVIDLVAPIGKGQRGLIVSPPKAGKTSVLQAIANAITTNHPEVHLMVVLVDERPEEVTDMQRSVKGEVIASTFDRHPIDHTTIAELSIERAKRLVEMGHDVVVMLDNLTRLGRAYNLAAPASGRILTGGVDSAALYPPKRFLGAARNIEGGGSLTILATALVETGSAMDQVIFEEFKGTGNMELKLDRKLAEKRIFPAIDIDPSGTRKEELLLAPEEFQLIVKLRRVLHALDREQAVELLLDRLKGSRSNVEFLMQVKQTAPGEGTLSA